MFIGREEELKLLREPNWRDRAQLTVIYGRRRVGKTALVETAYEKRQIWKFEGIEGESSRFQLENFYLSLRGYCGEDAPVKRRTSATWQEAFVALSECLANQEIMVFFDEFQWMAGMRKTLVPVFKWAWDNYLSKNRKCKFVICGSVSSFMVRQVLRSRALYGRIDTEIHLRPLTVCETRGFFPKSKSAQEILETHFVAGGVPQYLLELNPKKSLMQNLNDQAFSAHGYFTKEYNRIFISHFGKNPIYGRLVSELARKGSLTTDELSHAVGYTKGGRFTQFLEDLVLADFAERFNPIDKPINSRFVRYRLKDSFIHFYQDFVLNNLHAIESGTVQAYQILSGRKFDQWRGYAFERLCRSHAQLIAKALEFGGIRYEFGQWFRSDKGSAAQIDLLFVRADSMLTVCEMKYVNRIDSGVVESLERKLSVLQQYFEHGVQKVLVLGKKVAVPQKVRGYFDSVLFAEDVFL